jgi:hypothetical protein
MLPVSAAAGSILFASQTGAVDGMHPGVAVLVSVLAGGGVAATVHTVRASIRPVANLGLMGPPLSLGEDAVSAVLAMAAALVPIVVPFLLALLVLAAVALWQRRRTGRSSALGTR